MGNKRMVSKLEKKSMTVLWYNKKHKNTVLYKLGEQHSCITENKSSLSEYANQYCFVKRHIIQK